MRIAPGGTLLAAALAAACGRASPRAAVLFYQGLPAARLGAFSYVPDSARGRLLVFDGRLALARAIRSPRLSQPVACTRLGANLLVTERLGDGVVLDTAGRPVREWSSPGFASLYASNGRVVVASRSPYFIPLLRAESDTAPLLWLLDTLGHPVGGIATAVSPDNPFLAGIVNAGAVAVDSAGGIYFAPFARDEIRAYGAGGVARWTARRGLYPHETEPRYETRGKNVFAHLAIASLALTVEGGRLYVLGARDSTATARRLDVLDAATGRILETRLLTDTATTIALDGAGRILTYAASSYADSTAPAPGAREAFAPAFALPDTAGDTIRLADFAGRVTLVNFWASWCDPCREEFPHMAELYGRFNRRDFAIAGISDDVDRAAMLAFVRRYRPPFPILLGAGRMRATYHYRGLPFSVLLDRHGRVVERIFGFGGPEEFRRLRETIAKEIAVP